MKAGQRLSPGNSGWGTMALAALDSDAIALPAWTTDAELAAFIANPAKAKLAADEATSKPGETINAALAVPLDAAARRIAIGHVRHRLAFSQRGAIWPLGEFL